MLVQNLSLSDNSKNVTAFYVNWRNSYKRVKRQATERNVCNNAPIFVAAEIDPEQVNICYYQLLYYQSVKLYYLTIRKLNLMTNL